MNKLSETYDFIAIGGSSGALKAVSDIFSQLSNTLRIPIGMVLHRLAAGGPGLKRFLQANTQLPVVEPHDKQHIEESTVYLAPANYHLLVEQNRSFSFSYADAVRYSRPSIDIFFQSAAEAFSNRLVGILLSGGNEDGSEGMQHINKHGGQVIIQSPDDAQTPIMPRSVQKKMKPHMSGTCNEIAKYLNELNYGK